MACLLLILPWQKQGLSASHTPIFLRVCPWLLLMVSAKAGRTENRSITLNSRKNIYGTWELSPSPFKAILTLLWSQCDTWNEDRSVGARDLALENAIAHQLGENHPCAITLSLLWVDITKKHQWLSRLQDQFVVRQPNRLQCVKVLNTEPEGVLLLC